MPAGEPVGTKRRLPLHHMARVAFPQDEIGGVALFGIDLQARAGFQGRHLVARQAAIGGPGGDIEVDVFADLVRMPLGDELLHQHHHLADVVCGPGEGMGAAHPDPRQIRQEFSLHPGGHLPRTLAHGLRLRLQLVLSLVAVVLQVADIGHVHHLKDTPTSPLQGAPQQVGDQERAPIADSGAVVDGGAAVVHGERPGLARGHRLHLAGEAVEQPDR